ncbi:MAG: hypothetical protein FWD66_00955 [Paludibacter sp.]|nr:hypothetical protein [Paludibacter sp.]
MTEKAEELRNEMAFAGDFHRGLTKREYFAGLAMQAIARKNFEAAEVARFSLKEVALIAVVQADALLEELSKK